MLKIYLLWEIVSAINHDEWEFYLCKNDRVYVALCYSVLNIFFLLLAYFLNDQISFTHEFCWKQPGVNTLISPNIKGIRVLVGPISMLNLSQNINENTDSINMLGNFPASDK
jgi:hypothetical protein